MTEQNEGISQVHDARKTFYVTDCRRFPAVHDVVTKDENSQRKIYCDWYSREINDCRIVSSEQGCEVYNRQIPGRRLIAKGLGIGEKIHRIVKIIKS